MRDDGKVGRGRGVIDGAVRCSAVQCDAVRYGAVRCGAGLRAHLAAVEAPAEQREAAHAHEAEQRGPAAGEHVN